MPADAAADALHGLRFKVLENPSALTLARHQGPADRAEADLREGRGLVPLDAEDDQVEDGT